MKTYILHHNDPDGFGAAYAAYTKFGRKKSIEYIPVDYGKPFPVMEDGSNVYILDFSYSREILESLVVRMKSLLVIDHHKSAMLALMGFSNAIFDMNRSGAGLAWDVLVGTPRPDYINYIEDADLWRFALPDSKYVKNSLYQEDLTLDAFIKGAKKSIKKRISEGKVIQKVIDHNLQMGFDVMHTIKLDEYTMLAVNSCLHMSEFGNALYTKYLDKYNADFAGVYYRYTKDTYKFSLRSVGDFDVSLVCNRFGGGGHKNASGFEIPISRFNPSQILSGETNENN